MMPICHACGADIECKYNEMECPECGHTIHEYCIRMCASCGKWACLKCVVDTDFVAKSVCADEDGGYENSPCYQSILLEAENADNPV